MAKTNLISTAKSLREKGHTFIEIAKSLDVSRSTVSTWCRNTVLSHTAQTELERRVGDGRMRGRLVGARINKELREQRVQEAEKWAMNMVSTVDKRDLLLLGIGLYWGEGAKARKLNFTNTDPTILKCIMNWFELILNVEREAFLVRVYINELYRDRYKDIQTFWIQTLGIFPQQMYEPTFIKTPLRKVYENRETYYGVVSLRIRKSTELQYRILGLIKAVSNAGVAQVVRASHS